MMTKIIVIITVALMLVGSAYGASVAYNDEYEWIMSFNIGLSDSLIDALIDFGQVQSDISETNDITILDLNEDFVNLNNTLEFEEIGNSVERVQQHYNDVAGWSSVITPQYIYGQDLFGTKVQCQAWDRWKTQTVTINGQQLTIVVEGQDGIYEMFCAPIN